MNTDINSTTEPKTHENSKGFLTRRSIGVLFTILANITYIAKCSELVAAGARKLKAGDLDSNESFRLILGIVGAVLAGLALTATCLIFLKIQSKARALLRASAASPASEKQAPVQSKTSPTITLSTTAESHHQIHNLNSSESRLFTSTDNSLIQAAADPLESSSRPEASPSQDSMQNWTFWTACRKIVAEAYPDRQYTDLARAQTGLRWLLIFIVLATASTNLLLGPPSRYEMLTHQAHIFVGAFYGMFIAFRWRFQRHALNKCEDKVKDTSLTEDQIDELVGPHFWRTARLEMIFVIALIITDLIPSRPIHLACILPMMGIWLFLGQKASYIFFLLILSLILRTIFLVMVAFVGGLPLNIDAAGFVVSACWSLFSDCSFWLALGMVLVIMRQLRQTAKDKAVLYEAQKTTAEKSSEAARVAKIQAETANCAATKALIDANEATAKATLAERQAREALAQGELLRLALATLGDRLDYIIFAKNHQRRFIFANRLLLRQLAFLKDRNGWVLDSDNAVPWSSVAGLTDKEIGIEKDEYRMSDENILVHGHERELNYEPNFRDDQPEEPWIWTTKEAVIDPQNSAIVGLVGYAVPRLPLEMQQMSKYLTEKVPLYASMKDIDGHVIWANPIHLEELEQRLIQIRREELAGCLDLPSKDKLAKLDLFEREADQEKIAELKKFESLPNAAKLKTLRAGRGPRDEDLYGPEGAKYSAVDAVIIAAARAYKGSPNDFHVVIEQLLVDQKLGAERSVRDEAFPKCGWMEFHQFPNDNGRGGRWVEVWKMPWWEMRPDGSNQLKGILVFFEECHKTYLRRSIVWRWIERQFGIANDAQVDMLAAALAKKSLNPEQSLLSRFHLPRLLRRMLRWTRAFIDDAADELKLTQRKRKLSHFSHIAKVIESAQARGKSSDEMVHVQCSNLLSEAFEMEEHGDDLFCILTALIINAIEATQRTWTEKTPPPVVIECQLASNLLKFTIVNASGRPVPAASVINRLEGRNQDADDGRPGGGFYLAHKLTAFLGGRAKAMDLSAHDSSIEIFPSDKGSKVELIIPIQAFVSQRRDAPMNGP